MEFLLSLFLSLFFQFQFAKRNKVLALSLSSFFLARERTKISCIVFIQTTENSADGKKSRNI